MLYLGSIRCNRLCWGYIGLIRQGVICIPGNLESMIDMLCLGSIIGVMGYAGDP